MPGQPAANCGRPSDWRAMGTGRLGLAKREASSGNDNVDKLGLSVGEGIMSTTKPEETEPEFTEGVCADGAAILMDGQQLAIPEILERLRKGAEAERIVTEIWDMLYGQNMQVAGWHKNGDLEPIDRFFESNHWVVS